MVANLSLTNSVKLPFDCYNFNENEIKRLAPSKEYYDQNLHINDEIINNMLALLKLNIGKCYVQVYHSHFQLLKINRNNILNNSLICLPVHVTNHWFLVFLLKEMDNSVSILTFDTGNNNLDFKNKLVNRLESIQIRTSGEKNYKLNQNNGNECGIVTIALCCFFCENFQNNISTFQEILEDWQSFIGIIDNSISLPQANYWRQQINLMLGTKIYRNNWFKINKIKK
ncbi:hypothetical protein ACTA71_002863 [Dictyostelium dimigraforme]